MGDLIHHIIHFLMYSLVLWQFILGIYVILIWAKRNIKFEKTSPVINVSETKGLSHQIETSKNLGPVEVGVDRKTIIDTKSDEVSVKLDEKIKGKVKTQKNKLRELRKWLD